MLRSLVGSEMCIRDRSEIFVPIDLAPAIIETAINAAIRPYSIEVAPDSSDRNFLKISIEPSS